jgi:hypothetical protein
MTDPIAINSCEYWDHRFQTDWEDKSGPKQSRFFSDVAIAALPTWVLQHLKRRDVEFVDWGCAQGDGTDVWTQLVSPNRMTGVDFSGTSISQAADRYPAIRFKCENWLLPTKSRHKKYGVLFSSNTLEHFADPISALTMLSRRARDIMVIAVPFAEVNRFGEHMFTFLASNVPAGIGPSWFLVHSRVVDCRSLPGSMWAGDQGIFVYVSISAAESLGLTLNDVSIQARDQQKTLSLAERAAADPRQNTTIAWQHTMRESHHLESSAPELIAVSRINQRLLSIERLLNEQ